MKIAGARSSCGSKSRLEIYENLDITHKGFLLGIKCIAPHASGNVRYLNMIWNLWQRIFSNTDQYENKVNRKMWEISAFSVERSLQTPCRGLPGSRLRFETRRDGLPKDSRSCAKPRDYQCDYLARIFACVIDRQEFGRLLRWPAHRVHILFCEV